MIRIAVLVSGTGSILQAMLARKLPIVAVVTDRKCAALELAEEHGCEGKLVERTDFSQGFDRAAYSEQLAEVLTIREIDLVVMAGFGTVLAQPMFDAYAGRILNTHPALLPSFPGWHGVADALAYGVKVTGCTVHVATLEVDAGPILAQEVVRVRDDETTESLHERIKVVERELYVDTVAELVAEPSRLDGLIAKRC